MVAALTRVFGVHNLALAEDVVQDAFCRVLETWNVHAIPKDPGVADGDGETPHHRRASSRENGKDLRARDRTHRR
ncbi:MAG: hypothetical protein ABI442_06820 [Gemmatimonadaceae bacterium]